MTHIRFIIAIDLSISNLKKENPAKPSGSSAPSAKVFVGTSADEIIGAEAAVARPSVALRKK